PGDVRVPVEMPAVEKPPPVRGQNLRQLRNQPEHATSSLGPLSVVSGADRRGAARNYLHHFNAARPHQALAQLTPAQAETQPPHAINLASHQVRRKPILDGLTSEYHIAA